MAKSQPKNLSPKQICSIIKACGAAQVTVLKFGDLFVSFAGTPAAKGVNDPKVATQQSQSDPSSDTAISEIQHQVAQESLLHDELKVREDQVAELLITDPRKAEQLLRDGYLEEITHGSTGADDGSDDGFDGAESWPDADASSPTGTSPVPGRN